MSLMYLTIKAVHILAVVLFLGNIITGVFWKLHADRTRSPAVIANALDGVIRSDRWFTLPGVVVILVTGVWLAILAGFPILGTGWILWSLVLFGVSGALFMFFLAPDQRRMHALAVQGAASGTLDRDAYGRLSRRWEIVGVFATGAPLGALALMVIKPAL